MASSGILFRASCLFYRNCITERLMLQVKMYNSRSYMRNQFWFADIHTSWNDRAEGRGGAPSARRLSGLERESASCGGGRRLGAGREPPRRGQPRENLLRPNGKNK
ncbi:Serine/threonine-protein kinase LMTK1 [Manis javanica]|nr:Serine/threonine-protein kinase LMTK1 [Manis javanica]